jgi:hypothetical protein
MTNRKTKLASEDQNVSGEAPLFPAISAEQDPQKSLITQVKGVVSVNGLTDVGNLIGSLLNTHGELLEAVNGVRMDLQVLQELQVNKDNEQPSNNAILDEVSALISVREYLATTANNAYKNRATCTLASNMVESVDAKLLGILTSDEFKNYIGYVEPPPRVVPTR